VEARSLVQKLFGGLARRVGLSQVKVMAGYTPVFTPWGNKPYEADVVRAAVDAIARNAAKLKAKHVRRINGDVIPVGDQIERLLQMRPNPRMSAYDFLYKLISTTLLDNNAFAYPHWERGQLAAVWPINCVASEFLEDEAGNIYVKFYFSDERASVLPYEDVIHIRRHFYGNDLLGDTNQPINSTLSAIHTTNEGLAQAVKTSAHLRGLLKFSGMLKQEDMEAQRQKFVDQYMTVQNHGGIAATDAKAEYQELKNSPLMVNAGQMKELRDAVFRYFGVNESIVMGKYSEDDWNAFYESTIEPLAVQLSMEFTAKLFSDRERGHGNEIVFEANRLQYASVQTKLALVQLVDRGGMTPNEWREVFNLGPIEGGDKPIRRLDTRPTDEDKGGDSDDNAEPEGSGEAGDSSGGTEGSSANE
jgi:HK97 family phage portal protein